MSVKQSLYYNGTILTMAGHTPQYAEAVLVENGVIMAVGERYILAQDLHPKARRIDLKQKTMLPGFIEPDSVRIKQSCASMQTEKHAGLREIWAQLGRISECMNRYVMRGVTTVAEKECTQREWQLLKLAGILGKLKPDVVCDYRGNTAKSGYCMHVRTGTYFRSGQKKTDASVYEMLRERTIEAACRICEEEHKGSIQAGKDADFVIVAVNPLQLPQIRWDELPIRETIKADKTIWKK